MACTAELFFSDEKLISTRFFDISELENSIAIYEVVKVMQGKALFFEAHTERLRHSAKLAGQTIEWTEQKICEKVSRLISANNIRNGRLKYLFRFRNNEKPKFFAFFLNDITPPPALYNEGVKLLFWEAVRHSPGIKQINYDLRRSIKSFLKEKEAYEVLLINAQNEITEGSKSNFFVIQKNTLYTPPAGEVLAGITRNFVYEIAQAEGIKIQEKRLHVNCLADCESAFLSGTSIGILPVRQIENHEFDPSHPLLRKIHSAYQEITENYLSLREFNTGKNPFRHAKK